MVILKEIGVLITMNYDLIILGAGTAGLTASIYAACSGLKVLCIENQTCGGQIVNTSDIINYPGFKNISGLDFSQKLQSQAIDLGVDIKNEQICKIDLEQKNKTIITDNNEYNSKAVIIATGTRRRELGCKDEELFRGRGVTYCATCDGRFFKNKVVGVVGGGNTAVEDAIYLSNMCKHVYVIHRRNTFRASERSVKLMKQRKNITLKLNSIVDSIEGKNLMENVILTDTITNEKTNLPLNGLFIAVGLIPNSREFSKWVDLDEQGYIVAREDCETKTCGVFVAGDVRTKKIRQLVTAASDGSIAALASAEYINHIN